MKTSFMSIPRIAMYCLITGLLLPQVSLAKLTSYAQQRTLFEQVESSLERGDNSVYKKHKGDLAGYPLAGYLDYLYLSQRFRHLSQQDIDNYVAANPNLPQASRLQFQWLNWLAKKQRWQSYREAYSAMRSAGKVSSGGRYQCLQGRAFLATGERQAAWKTAENLWLVGKSQDKACDPLFHRWKKVGKLTQSLASQRFWLAVDKGQISLARYIDRSISRTSYKKDTRLFWRVYSQPSLLKHSSLLDGRKKHHRQIMLSGVKRLMSRDKDKALDLWLTLKTKHPFEPSVVSRTDKRLAMKFAKNFTDNADLQIARIDPKYKYPDVTKWRIRLALAQENWQAVQQGINKLPKTDQQRDRWSYWREVARIKLHTSPRQSEDYSSLSRLRQERSFYGFLVADLTDKSFQLNHKKPDHSLSDLHQVMDRYQGFARIKEWLALNRLPLVQSELNRIKPRLTVRERRLLPYVAKELGWHHQAIMAAAREAMWNDVELRFPAHEKTLFSRYAKKRGIDYPWAISIARQESAFNPSAHSHAGARGLMQLMPATARQAARQKQMSLKGVSDLYKPETNIALGTAHLEWLSKQFGDNRIFATAAYNAGGSAVRRWLKARGHLPLDIWIETIPYDETRRYVQNVMAFRVIYSLQEQDNVSMFSDDEALRLALTPAEQILIASNP